VTIALAPMRAFKSLHWLAIVGVAAITSSVVIASDHDEADTTSFDDVAADIGDMYAFHGGERLTLILTFDGYKLRQDAPNYDADLLYGLHIDTNGDSQPDHEIWARFGQNGAGDWAVKVEGVPGSDAAIIGMVGEVHEDSSGAQVFAGLVDDPFFFDLEGYKNTLMTGTLAFDPTYDFVAQKNTLALAVEFDHAALGSTNIAVWATTGRRG
jgi:hypothetical protein